MVVVWRLKGRKGLSDIQSADFFYMSVNNTHKKIYRNKTRMAAAVDTLPNYKIRERKEFQLDILWISLSTCSAQSKNQDSRFYFYSWYLISFVRHGVCAAVKRVNRTNHRLSHWRKKEADAAAADKAGTHTICCCRRRPIMLEEVWT